MSPFHPGLRLTLAATLFCGLASAQTAQHAKTPKPDLHAGGFRPSEIVNGVVTDVVLPGYHFTGAHVETQQKLCQLVSFEVVSDNEIHMRLKGNRAVDDDEWQCTITVRTPAGSASSWIAIKRTEAEEKEHETHRREANMAKAAEFVTRTGKSWRLSFAGGPAMTYVLVPGGPGDMPTFKSDSGATVQVAVTEKNEVFIIQPGCMRGGKLEGDEVKNGTSSGNCTPPGPWTGTVTR